MSDDEKLLEIVEYFGIGNQQRKLEEEVFELQESIIKFENGIGDIKEIITELTDVSIILDQIQEFYAIDDSEICDEYIYKLDRTIERIKEGYYDKDKGK